MGYANAFQVRLDAARNSIGMQFNESRKIARYIHLETYPALARIPCYNLKFKNSPQHSRTSETQHI